MKRPWNGHVTRRRASPQRLRTPARTARSTGHEAPKEPLVGPALSSLCQHLGLDGTKHIRKVKVYQFDVGRHQRVAPKQGTMETGILRLYLLDTIATGILHTRTSFCL